MLKTRHKRNGFSNGSKFFFQDLASLSIRLTFSHLHLALIFSFWRFLVGSIYLVEDAEIAGERFVRQLIGGQFICDIVVGGTG